MPPTWRSSSGSICRPNSPRPAPPPATAPPARTSREADPRLPRSLSRAPFPRGNGAFSFRRAVRGFPPSENAPGFAIAPSPRRGSAGRNPAFRRLPARTSLQDSGVQAWFQPRISLLSLHPMTPSDRTDSGPWWRSLTGYHWFVFSMASLAWMFDCLDQQLFILARPAAMRNLLPPGMDANEYGGYAAAIFVAGWATGGLIFGAVGDRVGRARTLT